MNRCARGCMLGVSPNSHEVRKVQNLARPHTGEVLNMTAQCVAGIDVSKARLDVFVLPQRLAFGCTNDEAGITMLRQKLQGLGVERVVLEATGGWSIAQPGRLPMQSFRSNVCSRAEYVHSARFLVSAPRAILWTPNWRHALLRPCPKNKRARFPITRR